MTKVTVLVYSRDYLVEDFRTNLEPLAEEWAFVHACDGRADGALDTRDAFQSALRSPPPDVPFTKDELIDIRQRCRLLRNIPEAKAMRRISAIAFAHQRLLDKVQPSIVLSHMVDEYILDVLSRLSRKRGLRFVGYCASFFPDSVQVTDGSFGAPFDVREASDAEVEATAERLRDDKFRQNYIQAPSLSYRDHLWRYLRYQVKRLVLPIKARLEGNPNGVHYEILPYIAEHRRLRDFPRADLFEPDWREGIERARASGQRVVYLPLSYAPESTNDYWVPNLKAAHFDAMILDLIKRLAREHLVVVKEHIHMIGARSIKFLSAISDIENVVHVHPTEFSNLVLAQSDALLLGGGSSGVEATLRGRPVFSYCESSYWFEASGATWIDLDKPELMADTITAGLEQHRPLGSEEQTSFLRKCLASTVRLRGYGQRWPLVDPEDMRSVLTLALAARS